MLYTSPAITVYFILLAAALGACLGSFLNCAAWRMVHGESVLRGRSHCDACGHVLGAGDLVPVFGYVAHRGKCRYCGEKLSKRHLFAELICALVLVFLLLRFDISLRFLEYALFACILLGASFADLEGYIIPDRFIISGIVVRVIFVLLSGDIPAEGLSSLAGGFFIALGVFLAVLVMEKLLKREAMGGGDIKLLFVTGLFLGWQKNLLALLLACLIGIVAGLISLRGRDGEGTQNLIPWGPSIAGGALISLLIGDRFINWYISLF